MTTAIAKTACWTAAARARESERKDALFRDAFAGHLAGSEGFAWFDRLSVPMAQSAEPNPYLAIRTRFFDDFLLHVACDHGLKQFVFLAAGMDTRAARLEWPAATRIFELDYPEVLQRKKAILARLNARLNCEQVMVGVDLMTPWEDALIDAGYETVAPSVWLLEGLLVYLDESTVLRLLDCVTKLTTPNSWLGADVVNNAFLKSAFYQTWSAFLDRQGASWKFASDRPESLLSSRGWKAKVTQPGEEGANFGRWPYPVLPREIPDVPRSFLIQASQNRPR